MSDLIRRDEALAGILNHYEVNNEIQNKEMDYCFDMLNSLRAVDAVEVVRCGECWHRFAGHFGMMCIGRPNDFFCANGERREDNAVD